jgi:uncharacterized protein (TIGR02145 family)
MRNNFFKISVFIANVAIVFTACSKDNFSTGNPFNGKTTASFKPRIIYSSIIDQDGNTYKVVTIGTQTWMAENLRTTKFNDGLAIVNVTNDVEWSRMTSGAYCNYNNTINEDTIATYGRIYNWYAVNTGKLAPEGWHIPTLDDWITLTDYLGGISVAGGKLKETETKHWTSPNTGATNQSGFTALPGGSRLFDKFYDIGLYGDWWSSSAVPYINGTFLGGVWSINYNEASISYSASHMEYGFSVRCVMD